MTNRLSSRWLGALTVAAVALPLVVAVAALAQRRWYPVLDLAMTEFRVRDVGSRNTPLIGLPGRIGSLPDQGSHPGPLSFWALAPMYRLFGGSAWALEVATVSVALIWTALAIWIGYRRLGRAGIVLVGAVVAILIRGFGLSVLTQPWNPYMPLLAWLVVLLATWSVLCDDDWMLLPLLAAATFAAQTHIPYLLMAGTLGLFAAGWVAVRERRITAPLGYTVGSFVVLWLAPLVDQLRRDPGNVRRLIDHFGSPSDDPIGVAAGVRLLLRHLDVLGGFVELSTGSERFVQGGLDPDGPIWPGLAMMVLWGISVVISIRMRHQPLIRLHSVLAMTLLLTVVSMSRIFGARWFYLTLWAWVTTTLVIVATIWTAVVLARRVWPENARFVSPQRVQVALTLLAVCVTASMVVLAPSTDHPEEYLGETVGELLAPTTDALDPDTPYLVEWRDAYFFGSQGFALLAELERSGFDVGATEFNLVPATSSRTKRPGEAATAVVLVTGEFISAYDADGRFERVAFVDPRTPDEVDRYEQLRTQVTEQLTAAGLDDLVELVDTNLFGLDIDERTPPATKALTTQMIALGQPAAVFVGPPATPVV